MRWAALATAILITALPIVPLAQFLAVDANPYTFAPGLHADYPTSGLSCTPDFTIAFKYYLKDNVSEIDSFSYNLDNKGNFPLPFFIIPEDHWLNGITYRVYAITVHKTLENLANGVHTIVVYAHCTNGTVNSIINTTWTIDTTLAIPFTPFIISPQNQTTYSTNQVPLTYTIGTDVLWSYYSVDSRNNSALKNFNGNITLPTLSEGQHELMLAVTTKTSPLYDQPTQTVQKVTFFVDTTNPNPAINPATTTPTTELFPVPTQVPELPAALALTILVLVTLTALASFRRIKKHGQN